MEKISKNYQHDADIFRMRHLKYYADLIEEYRAETGKYPLQGESNSPHYVLLAAPHQKKYATETPKKSKVTEVEQFRTVLEAGLKRDVSFKFDPQKVPDGAPNFYIYMIEGDTYYFTVNLYNTYPFSTRLDKHYNKLEITNAEPDSYGLWNADELFEYDRFKFESSKKPHKEGLFIELEKKYK